MVFNVFKSDVQIIWYGVTGNPLQNMQTVATRSLFADNSAKNCIESHTNMSNLCHRRVQNPWLANPLFQFRNHTTRTDGNKIKGIVPMFLPY
jgi:hypothetical protein